jgi:hypothetical protein
MSSREVLKLHRSGMSLREIAEQLGISHQRVHQIVGTEEPETQKRRRLAGGVAVIVLILLIGGFAFSRTIDRVQPTAFGPAPVFTAHRRQPATRVWRMVQQAPPVARMPNADRPLFVCSIQPGDIIVFANSKGGNATTRHAAHPRAN